MAESHEIQQSVIPPDAGFVPGRVLVRFEEEIGKAEQIQTLADIEASVVGEIEEIMWLGLEVKAGHECERIEQLRVNPSIKFAEPDYLMYLIQ